MEMEEKQSFRDEDSHGEDTKSHGSETYNEQPSRRRLIRGAYLIAGLAGLGAEGAVPDSAVSKTNPAGDGGRFLNGHVAIVTGAARGIGRAIATTLASAGANIVAVDFVQNLPELQYDLASYSELIAAATAIRALGVKCLPIPTDVRDGGQMMDVAMQAMAAFGRIDILVANAGVQISTRHWLK